MSKKNTTNTNTTNTTTEAINNLPNKGRPNWGTLRSKPIVDKMQEFNTLRKDTILLHREQAKDRELLLMRYPGYFKKDSTKGSKQVYVTAVQSEQVLYNEEEAKLSKRHKEANKADKAKYAELYADIMPKDFYKSYVAFATYAVNKSGFKQEVYKYLVNGLGIEGLAKQGLDQFTQTLCDAIGITVTSDTKFAKEDKDTEPMNEQAFYKTVMSITRDILVSKNVIQRDSLDKDDAENKIPEAEKETAPEESTLIEAMNSFIEEHAENTTKIDFNSIPMGTDESTTITTEQVKEDADAVTGTINTLQSLLQNLKA